MKRRWHFKKWFQRVLEVITVTAFLLLLGVCNEEFTLEVFLFMASCLSIFGAGGYLLSRYGVYND